MSARIDAVMRQRNIRSQSELARVADVPQSTVNRILTRGDSYCPAWGTVKKLADALGVSAVWLTDGDASANPTAPAMPTDAPLDGWQLEALRILGGLDDVDRRKVMGVLRLLERPGNSGQR
ncbi:helix-turn-helix domain-containing protein [Pigmentiphaga aceris]|nr:helix-turn-helix transcriptional regulator [Pigmentiphaga aceris]